MINYISNLIMPVIILVIIIYGLLAKIKVFDMFSEGANEGIELIFKILPTLVGLFVAVGLLRDSGLIDELLKLIKPLIVKLNMPIEVMPLAILKPISGSASMAVGSEIIKKYGVDSKIGIMASTIMGSTETTLYVIAIYTNIVKVKKTRFILISSLIGDIVGIAIAVTICNFMI